MRAPSGQPERDLKSHSSRFGLFAFLLSLKTEWDANLPWTLRSMERALLKKKKEQPKHEGKKEEL
jgi:hypothetical protein